jgi:hypothetical protein
MRKLIMWNLVTLDGFFEGPKSWEIDWHDALSFATSLKETESTISPH